MYKLSFCFLFISNCYFSQNNKDVLMKGPINVLNGGVMDGVVENDEIIERSKIEYEHVRRADYVWSKRVFSRIDCREKLNHVLFFPPDKFLEDYTDYPPKNIPELQSTKAWVRHGERRSLWTIIVENLMSDELDMYLVADTLDFKFASEDGYAFKYPLSGNANNYSYFDPSNSNYRGQINKRIGISQNGSTWFGDYQGQTGTYEYKTIPGINKFQVWVDTIKNRDYDVNNVGVQWQAGILTDLMDPKFEKAWDKAMAKSQSSGQPESLEKEPRTFYLNSEMITAYNIKEDWFFDKERSILDRRIIAIAPVAKFTLDTSVNSKRGALVVKHPATGQLTAANLMGTAVSISNSTQFAEFELFWLYFPQLRNVLVKYYVYNEQSDAQWMSFDDLFWKRKFNSTIYRVSDKFDREIEDYKYGVDALYEAERIKDDIRKWEIDVWNY
jgi:hypothetical protein